jgi:hypothetical protein
MRRWAKKARPVGAVGEFENMREVRGTYCLFLVCARGRRGGGWCSCCVLRNLKSSQKSKIDDGNSFMKGMKMQKHRTSKSVTPLTSQA